MLNTHLAPMSKNETRLKQAELEGLLAVAERFRRVRDWDATATALDAILTSEPGRRGMVARSDLAELWNRKGLCAFAIQDHQTAADCFNRGLRALTAGGVGANAGTTGQR